MNDAQPSTRDKDNKRVLAEVTIGAYTMGCVCDSLKNFCFEYEKGMTTNPGTQTEMSILPVLNTEKDYLKVVSTGHCPYGWYHRYWWSSYNRLKLSLIHPFQPSLPAFCYDIMGYVAYNADIQALQAVSDPSVSTFSSYYKGYLVVCVTQYAKSLDKCSFGSVSRHLQLLEWLLEDGADMVLDHMIICRCTMRESLLVKTTPVVECWKFLMRCLLNPSSADRVVYESIMKAAKLLEPHIARLSDPVTLFINDSDKIGTLFAPNSASIVRSHSVAILQGPASRFREYMTSRLFCTNQERLVKDFSNLFPQLH